MKDGQPRDVGKTQRHKDKQNNNNTKHSIETQYCETEFKKRNEAKTKYYNIWHLMFKNEIKHPTGPETMIKLIPEVFY